MNALILSSSNLASTYFAKALYYENITGDPYSFNDEWEKLSYKNNYNLIICKFKNISEFSEVISNKLINACLAIPCIVIGPDSIINRFMSTSAPFIVFSSQKALKSICFELKSKIYSSAIPTKTNLVVADLVLDRDRRLIYRFSKKIYLKNKEFQLLEYFMHNPDRTLSRNQIIEHVWDLNATKITKSLDVHVNKIRTKVDYKKSQKLIETLHGVGYRICSSPFS